MNKYEEAIDILADRENTRVYKKAINDIKELLSNYKQLQVNLDKACGELAISDKMLHQYTNGAYMSKEQWKAWLLK